jgi:hypothetical protein
MYILYIDESGNTGAKDDLTQRLECLCGVLISDVRYRKWSAILEDFLHSKKFPDDFEIKGYDLFHGEGYWINKTVEERVVFCKELSKQLARCGLSFYIKISKKTGNQDPYIMCLENIINKVAQKVSRCGKTNRQLLLIFDQRKDISSIIIKSCVEQKKKLIEKYKKSCTFIDSGFESNSLDCIFLQIADFVAYFYRRQKSLTRNNNLFQRADKHITIKTIDEIVENVKSKIIKVA